MSVIATNKKAYHNYHLSDKWECGIVLTGPEVKSLRAGHASFTDAFARVDKGAVFLYNVYISPYAQASYNNEEENRPRKLLMHTKEIERIDGILSRTVRTLVPTKIYFNKRGMVKVEIALAEGKKSYDKRSDIKTRQVKREIDRAIKRTQ